MNPTHKKVIEMNPTHKKVMCGMNIANKKLIAGAVLLVTVLSILAPQVTHAVSIVGAITSTWDCATAPASCTINLISLLINGFLSILIGLFAALMRVTLQFNDNVVNLPAVQSGFGVSLAIANLGFVLAIIVIALATILRSQTYGVKQLLWKLVVAAVIVNFSLVIAGAILGFSSSFTRYFIDAATGGTHPISGSSDYTGFVNRITSAFGPQAVYAPPTIKGALASSCGDPGTFKYYICGTVGSIANATTDVVQPGGFFAQIISLFMSQAFLAIVLLTFGAITIMLLIRFVYIAILLILAPLAWLLWIFPTTSSNLSKWWSHFIRWTFFPPIVVFFLYLAIMTGSGSNKSYLDSNLIPPAGTNPNNLPEAGLMVALKGAVGANVIPQIEQGIILIALALGGLFAANSLSIMGASVAMGMAKSAGGAVRGYVGKQAKKGARATYQKAGGERLNKFLQTSGRIPGVSAIGRGLATLTEKGGKGLVDAEMSGAKSKSSDRLATELQGLRGHEQRLAYLSVLEERGDLDKVKGDRAVAGMSLDDYQKNEEVFNSYGQGKLAKALNLNRGGDNTMSEAAALLASNPSARMTDKKGLVGAVGEEKGAAEIMKAAVEKFAKSIEGKDGGKIGSGVNEALAGNPVHGMDPAAAKIMSKYLIKAMAVNNHLLTPKVIVKLGGDQLGSFRSNYKEGLDESSLREEIKTARLGAVDDTMAARATLMFEGSGGGATATAPAATAPSTGTGGTTT